ncbi:MAG: hypothetical protein K0R08_2018 [Solimicrobium sp.]|nr:hypothetical protein [Solimicrobium sp.]
MYPIGYRGPVNYSLAQESFSLNQRIVHALDNDNVSEAIQWAKVYIDRQPPTNLENIYSHFKHMGEHRNNQFFIQEIDILRRCDTRVNKHANHFITSHPHTELYRSDNTSTTPHPLCSSKANFAPQFFPQISNNSNNHNYPFNYDNKYTAQPNPFDSMSNDYDEYHCKNNLAFHKNFAEMPADYALSGQSNILTNYGKSLVEGIIPFVGKLLDKNGNIIGSCVLIGDRKILASKHCVKNDNTPVYVNFSKSQRVFQLFITDHGKHQDYTFLHMKENFMPHNVKYPKLRILSDNDIISNSILLHYPNNSKSLLISGNSTVNDHLLINQTLSTYHTTRPGSSGGIYIDNNGNIIAIHTGVDKNSLLSQQQRVGLTMRSIKEDTPYFSEFYDDLDLEGFESQKMLYEKSWHILPKEFTRKDGGVTIATIEGMKWVRKNHIGIFEDVYNSCLGIGGLHKTTHDYSILRYIESDHILPSNVIKNSIKNKALQKYVDPSSKFYMSGGKRVGEYGMPAITIPYGTHRNLLTTGLGFQERKIKDSNGNTVKERVNKTRYHETLINLCNMGNVFSALDYQIQDYYENGLCTRDYATGIIANIQCHLNVGAITTKEAKKLIVLVNRPSLCARRKIKFENNEYSLVKR